MLFRAMTAGVFALTLSMGSAVAGDVGAAGTDDDDIGVPVAPVGSLGLGAAGAGGVSTAAVLAGGVLAVGVAAAVLDGNDGSSSSGTATATATATQ